MHSTRLVENFKCLGRNMKFRVCKYFERLKGDVFNFLKAPRR